MVAPCLNPGEARTAGSTAGGCSAHPPSLPQQSQSPGAYGDEGLCKMGPCDCWEDVKTFVTAPELSVRPVSTFEAPVFH